MRDKKMELIAVGLVLACGAMYGQGRRRNSNATPPTPAQMAQREANRLTRFFNLSTTQQSAVLQILTNADTQTQSLSTQIQPLRTTLVTAIKSNATSQIGSTIMQISNLQEQEQVIRADAAGQIYTTVLTADQQGQLGSGLGPLMGAMGGPGRGFGRVSRR